METATAHCDSQLWIWIIAVSTHLLKGKDIYTLFKSDTQMVIAYGWTCKESMQWPFRCWQVAFNWLISHDNLNEKLLIYVWKVKSVEHNMAYLGPLGCRGDARWQAKLWWFVVYWLLNAFEKIFIDYCNWIQMLYFQAFQLGKAIHILYWIVPCIGIVTSLFQQTVYKDSFEQLQTEMNWTMTNVGYD